MINSNKDSKYIKCKICGSISTNIFNNHLNLPYYHCDNCETLFNPEVKDNSEEFLGDNPKYYYRHEAVRMIMFKQEVLRLKSFCPSGNFLDFGGGAGYLALIALKNDYNSFLVEPNPVGREVAKNKNGLSEVYQNIDEIPENIKFDIVVLNHVIEHVVDPILELTKIRLRIKPGGVLLTTQPNFDFYGGLWYRLLMYLNLLDIQQILSKGHVVAWNSNSLKYTLSKVGFNSITVIRPITGRQLYEKFPIGLSKLIINISYFIGIRPAFALLAKV